MSIIASESRRLDYVASVTVVQRVWSETCNEACGMPKIVNCFVQISRKIVKIAVAIDNIDYILYILLRK